MHIATRPSLSCNGVWLRVPGYAFTRALPHDLAHFVVEGNLGLNRGFWGSLADRAEFGGMEWIEGRRKPHATHKAKTIGKENADYLSEAELLVACFARIVEGNLDQVPQLADTQLRKALATVPHRPQAVTASDIAKVCAAWRVMQGRWSELPVGESIHIEWPASAKHRRR